MQSSSFFMHTRSPDMQEVTPFMSFTPDEAEDRMHELGRYHAAKVLYGAYCRFRNTLTGRTNVHNEKLSARSGIELTQISVSKRLLLEKGWVVRDPEELKYGVIPVMGAAEFQNRRAWKFQQMEEPERWAFFNTKVRVWNYVKSELVAASFNVLSRRAEESDWANPNLTVSTSGGVQQVNWAKPNFKLGLAQSEEDASLLSLPYREPSSSAAAAASNWANPNLTVQQADSDKTSEICDPGYPERVIEAGRYPPELTPDEVRRVYRHFVFDCTERGNNPSKKLFNGYLKREAEEKLHRGQIALPTAGGAQMVVPKFEPGARPTSADAPAPGNVTYPLRPDASCGLCEGREEFRTSGGLYCQCRICQRCFGYGMQTVQGHGARRCPHITGQLDDRQARAV